MWDMRLKKWHWNRPVCEYFRFPPSDRPTSAPFKWFESCGMWRRVTCLVFPTFWTDVAASCSWTAVWRRNGFCPSKLRWYSTDGRSVTFQKTWIFTNTAVSTSHIALSTCTFIFKAAFNRTTNERSLETHQRSDGRSEIEGHREMKVLLLYLRLTVSPQFRSSD
jgi:hypothetical protein